MPTKFSAFMQEIEDEARAEGPDAVEDLDALRAHFRVGRQISEARRTLRLTQKRVAELAGLDQGDVSRIERGAGNPTFDTLDALARAVGMEIELRPRRPSCS